MTTPETNYSFLKTLSPDHQADLLRSGLSAEIITRMGIRSLTKEACSALGSTILSAYHFSYPHEPEHPGRHRVFHSQERDAKGDKLPKYLSAAGSRNAIYQPPGLTDLLRNTDQPLLITEGEKKAAKAVQEGYPCVGIAGVWNWGDSLRVQTLRTQADRAGRVYHMNRESPVMATLLKLAKHRRVYLIVDSDAAQNPDVHRAVEILAYALLTQVSVKAIYKPVVLPSLSGEKIGLDDLLCQPEGKTTLDQLLVSAAILPRKTQRIPYASREGGATVLNYLLPHHYPANDTFLPTPQQEELKRDENNLPVIEHKPLDGAPLAWCDRTYKVVDSPDGFLTDDDPLHPPLIVDAMAGITSTREKVIWEQRHDTYTQEYLVGLGFTGVDTRGIGTWRRLLAAQKALPDHRVEWATYRRGWLRTTAGRAYAYGNRLITEPGMPPITLLSHSGRATQGVQTEGVAEDWEGAMRLILENASIAWLCGFAASSMLLHFLPDAEPGMIHLVGNSGRGKTTALRSVAALLGSPAKPSDRNAVITTWRTTEAGLEAPLEARNDAFVLLDEIGMAPARTDWSALAYSITNGSGKGRSTIHLTERERRVWRTQTISTGEHTVASRIRESGSAVPRGLLFRVIDLHIGEVPFWEHFEKESVQPGAGAYRYLAQQYRPESLHIDEAGEYRIAPNDAMDAIMDALMKNHGHLWPRMAHALMAEETQDAVVTAYREFMSYFGKQCNDATPTVVRRRAKHLAIAMTGLHLLLSQMQTLSEEERTMFIDKALRWSVAHVWKAGLDDLPSGNEQEEIGEQVIQYLTLNPRRLYVHDPDRPWSTGNDYFGWINDTGGVFLPTQGFNALCAELHLDPARTRHALEGFTEENRWKQGTGRPPHSGRAGKVTRGFESPAGIFKVES